MPGPGTSRAVRLLAFATTALLLVLALHAPSTGPVPPPGVLLALGLLTGLVVHPLTARQHGLAVVVPALLLAQTALHGALLLTAGTLSGVDRLVLCPPSRCPTGSSPLTALLSHAGVALLVVQLVAAVLLAVALGLSDSSVRGAGRAVAAAVSQVVRLPLGLLVALVVPVRPTPLPAAPVRPRRVSSVWTPGVRPRRGPPRAAVPAVRPLLLVPAPH